MFKMPCWAAEVFVVYVVTALADELPNRLLIDSQSLASMIDPVEK